MTGISGLGSPFKTTPPLQGYYGFGSLGTLINSLTAPPTSDGGYPTTEEASNLAYYGIYIETNPFGSAYTRVGDVFGNFGAPRLDLGGFGFDAYSIVGSYAGTSFFKADPLNSVYFLGRVDENTGSNWVGFYASEFGGEFSINAGSSPSNPPIKYTQGDLSFNVNSIIIGGSNCYTTGSVTTPVKNLIIIDDTGTPRAIPIYNVP